MQDPEFSVLSVHIATSETYSVVRKGLACGGNSAVVGGISVPAADGSPEIAELRMSLKHNAHWGCGAVADRVWCGILVEATVAESQSVDPVFDPCSDFKILQCDVLKLYIGDGRDEHSEGLWSAISSKTTIVDHNSIEPRDCCVELWLVGVSLAGSIDVVGETIEDHSAAKRLIDDNILDPISGVSVWSEIYGSKFKPTVASKDCDGRSGGRNFDVSDCNVVTG